MSVAVDLLDCEVPDTDLHTTIHFPGNCAITELKLRRCKIIALPQNGYELNLIKVKIDKSTIDLEGWLDFNMIEDLEIV